MATENPLTQTPAGSTAKGKPKFQKLRQVTLPVLKMKHGEERYVYFIGAMHVGEAIEARANKDGVATKKKEPATIAHALDMETGEEGILICSAMLRGELNKHYPAERYVGRGFSVSHTRVPDRDYNIVTIVEVAVPDEIQAAGTAIRKALRAAEAAPPMPAEGTLKAVG